MDRGEGNGEKGVAGEKRGKKRRGRKKRRERKGEDRLWPLAITSWVALAGWRG